MYEVCLTSRRIPNSIQKIMYNYYYWNKKKFSIFLLLCVGGSVLVNAVQN